MLGASADDRLDAKTAEFIELNFVLTATGADFKEIFKTG